jgi:hypothetical protein
MSNNTNEFEELIPHIKEMLSDPSIQEFHPVLNKMLRGCESPDYDNTSDVIEEFCNNNADYVFRKLSEAAFQNAAMTGHRKRWYEL